MSFCSGSWGTKAAWASPRWCWWGWHSPSRLWIATRLFSLIFFLCIDVQVANQQESMVLLTTPKSLFCALPFNPLVPSCHFVQEVEEQRLPEPALGGADEAGTHPPDFESLQNCSVWTFFFVHWCSGSEPAGIVDWTCWWWQGGWWRVGGHKTTFPRSSLAMVRLTTPKSLFCALPFNPLVPSCHLFRKLRNKGCLSQP